MEGTMEDQKTVETQPTQTVEVQEEQKQSKKSSEIVRELSKAFSVNLFDEGGVQALLDNINAQKSKATEYEGMVKEYQSKEQLFAQKEQEYQVKIEALGMGFKSDSLDEVMALAKVNLKEGMSIIDGLKAVKTKYGSLFAPQNIGTQHNDLNQEKPSIAKNEQ
jgi:hypothetical protein